MAQHRDYLKKEVEKIGAVLARLLASIIKPGAAVMANDLSGKVADALNAELQLKLDELLQVDDSELIDILEQRNYAGENIKNLADLLYGLALQENDGTQKLLLRVKALALYKHVATNGANTAYFDVPARIKELEDLKA